MNYPDERRLPSVLDYLNKRILARRKLNLSCGRLEKRLQAVNRCIKHYSMRDSFIVETGLYPFEDEELYSAWRKKNA